MITKVYNDHGISGAKGSRLSRACPLL